MLPVAIAIGYSCLTIAETHCVPIYERRCGWLGSIKAWSSATVPRHDFRSADGNVHQQRFTFSTGDRLHVTGKRNSIFWEL